MSAGNCLAVSKHTSFPLIAHTTLCVLLGCGFLWFAAWEVVQLGRSGPVSPFHTTDKYLDFLIGNRGGSERLTQLMAALPRDEPVAVVYRDGEDGDTLLAYLVAYFAWPREAQAVPIRGDNFINQAQLLRARPYSGIFFCGIKPPSSLQRTVSIGNGLVLAPRAAIPE